MNVFIGSIKVAIFWFFSGLCFLGNILPNGTLITLVPSTELTSELFPEKLFTKLGNSKFVIGKLLTLQDLKFLLIASNTPKTI